MVASHKRAREHTCGDGRNRSLQGFTLIELLVVIAIISILMTILIPSLQQAKEQARLVTCQSKMRSIGVSLGMYSSQCSGFLPPNTTNVRAWWARNLLVEGCVEEGTWGKGHESAEGLLLCGSTENPSPDHLMLSSYGPTLNSIAGSGSPVSGDRLNGTTGGMLLSFNISQRGLPKRTDQVLSGSVLMIEKRVVFKSDTVWSHIKPPYITSYDWNVPNETNYKYDWSGYSAAYRHDGRANYLFSDYHVESFSAGTLFSGEWVPAR